MKKHSMNNWVIGVSALIIVGLGLLVNTVPHVDLCQEGHYNGFGSLVLLWIFMLALVTGVCGGIGYATSLKPKYLEVIVAMTLLVGGGFLAYYLGGWLGIQDCPFMSPS